MKYLYGRALELSSKRISDVGGKLSDTSLMIPVSRILIAGTESMFRRVFFVREDFI